MKFLREDSKVSTTRVVMFIGTLGAVLIMAAMVFYISFNTVKDHLIEWSGMSLLIGAISAYMATLLYGKVQQKKIENEESNKHSDGDSNTSTTSK